jgi:hypothetical protein
MTTTTLDKPTTIIEHAFVHVGVQLAIEAIVIGGAIVLAIYLWSKRPRRRTTA